MERHWRHLASYDCVCVCLELFVSVFIISLLLFLFDYFDVSRLSVRQIFEGEGEGALGGGRNESRNTNKRIIFFPLSPSSSFSASYSSYLERNALRRYRHVLARKKWLVTKKMVTNRS